MDRILVEVYIPVLSMTVDVFVPVHISVYEMLELLKKAIVELSNDVFVADEYTELCYRSDGRVLNINQLVQELDLHNGSRLMLI